MPTIFSELLPPTRTDGRRGLTWEPHPASAGCDCAGLLLITGSKKKARRYQVTEVYPDRNYDSGRAFQLIKEDGEVYWVFLADDRPRSTCDCAGWTYQATAKADAKEGVTPGWVEGHRAPTLGCCHLDSVYALVWNGWLPESRANPDQDTSNTEVPEIDESDLPACFRGLGSVPTEAVPF